MTVAIRTAQRADLVAIAAIERASFGDPWTRSMFSVHLDSGRGDVFLVATDDAHIVGYAITRIAGAESELLNIAVGAERRTQGIGAILLDAAMEHTARSGASEMWLEVRESNAAARRLYDTRGFVAVGVRKRYYHAPREDALVLRADLRAAARGESRSSIASASRIGKSVTPPSLGFTA
jgi:[ribosomal protein S18]-alanine N-acetyltransferase